MTKCKKHIFWLFMLVSITACAENTNNDHTEAKHLKSSSEQELATRVADLEELLRKYRRLVELKNEQIVELKKDLAKASQK